MGLKSRENAGSPAAGIRAWAARCKMGWVACCFLVTAALPAAPASVAAGPSEYQLKAIFLFNFAQFVEWPADAFPSADAPLAICVAGTDPFGVYLDEVVRGEQVRGRALGVKKYRTYEEAAGGPAGDCHILFLGEAGLPVAARAARVGDLPAAVNKKHVLTVSDADSVPGTMIQFVAAASRVKLRIDPVLAGEAGLVISSKLLRASEIVNARQTRP